MLYVENWSKLLHKQKISIMEPSQEQEVVQPTTENVEETTTSNEEVVVEKEEEVA
jgi:hypothetical protein